MTEYIESREEWDAFWGWFKNHLPGYLVTDPKSLGEASTPFKKICEIAIYDWYHYKRTEMKWLSDLKRNREKDNAS